MDILNSESTCKSIVHYIINLIIKVLLCKPQNQLNTFLMCLSEIQSNIETGYSELSFAYLHNLYEFVYNRVVNS
jgi:hypothetical protein